MMPPAHPAPTVTTLTRGCTAILMISLRSCRTHWMTDRQDHIRIGVCTGVKAVHHRHTLRRANMPLGFDVLRRIGTLRTRIADEQPADHIGVATVHRVAEHAID